MIATIKCLVCNEIMGTIEKPEITEADIAEYRQMVSCTQGHQESVLNGDPEE